MAVREAEKTTEKIEDKKTKPKKRLGVYWTAFITAAAVLVFLNVAAVMWKTACDFYADHIFRIAAATTGRFSALFPFSLGEVLITLAIVLVFAAIVISILLIFLRRKIGYKKFAVGYLKTVLALVLVTAYLYTFNCSFLYCSTFLNFAGGTREFELEEFEQVRNLVVNECNALAPTMTRKDDGTLIFSGNADTAAIDALHGVSGKFPRLAGYYPRAKQMWGSYYMYKAGVIGVFFPFSMEANYSKYVSDSYMPSVLAHEYSHLKGYIYESEANFMAFIACVNSDIPEVRYSGWLGVLAYIDDDYKNAVPESRYNAQPQISNYVKFDNTCYDRETWEYLKKRDAEQGQPKAAEIAENVSDKMMGSYMEAFDYKPNYSEVTLLMMQYYTEFGGFEIS